jgi:mannose-6-phosphate isomerase-like protein (cupin superfamily)
VTFYLGDISHRVGPGDIVIAPADVPHKFINDGSERLDLVCIHANPTFATEWLE